MKPTLPHDPRNDAFDDLIAAALHGELTPEERAQFDSRLQTDPAAAAAYKEAQAMHDLLEKTNRTAQPDPDFEQRMVSGVRRKLAQPAQRETAWESLLILWRAVTGSFAAAGRLLGGRSMWTYGGVFSAVLVVGFLFFTWQANQVKSIFTTSTRQLAVATGDDDIDKAKDSATLRSEIDALKAAPASTLSPGRSKKITIPTSGWRDSHQALESAEFNGLPSRQRLANIDADQGQQAPAAASPPAAPSAPPAQDVAIDSTSESKPASTDAAVPIAAPADSVNGAVASAPPVSATTDIAAAPVARPPTQVEKAVDASPPASPDSVNLEWSETVKGEKSGEADNKPASQNPAATTPSPQDSRKLIRNAQLDLEVKSFQAAFDQITVMTRAAGGYVDTSNSQRGGNGKLQGTVVVKILPPNLDAFLLRLRDLGDVQNQSVSTDDVTKDYFDTQARLVNSQKMELQLQDLLKRENGKVSDLLAVERELGRVRGDIESMQGQLKLYDFQVQYATVTMNLAEKDLNQAAAYLLRELDDFSLYSTDVEGTFEKARVAAADYKAQVLVADLKHNSGSDVSAMMVVSVPPEQIEPFLAQIRSLGRVANFTRDTKRVPKDGGDPNQPADQALTQSDKVTVNIAIRSDDESRKQVALTVIAKAVDAALDQAKAAALAQPGVEILGSSLNKAPQGASTAQLSVRVPGKEYATVLEAFRALGRAASLTIQRHDNSGPGASGDDAPVILSLSLTDEETPVQTTDLVIVSKNVDELSQQIKKDAVAAGVEVKASSFEGQPNGTHLARMTLFLPIAKYPDYIATLKKTGRVQSLSVQRSDASGIDAATDEAPVAISLALTDDDPPVQATQLVIVADDVDAQSQQIKKQAAAAGVEVKDSSFGRDPDGSEHAQMTLRLSMGQYITYVESLKKAGKVEALSVQREDRPDVAAADDSAPVEISLQLHNESAIVPDNGGLWATLRQMFGEGFGALFGSVRVIGVLLAFVAPWVLTLVLLAWIGRRIYVWRRK